MAVGDKKPVVMEADIGQTGGPAALVHASRHASGGADPITPSMIGAKANVSEFIQNSDIKLWAVANPRSVTVIADTSVASFPVEGQFWLVDIEYSPQANWWVLDATNIGTTQRYKTVCNAGTWNTWKEIATTDYAVNKAGDTMTGKLQAPSVFVNQVNGNVAMNGGDTYDAWLHANAGLFYCHLFNKTTGQIDTGFALNANGVFDIDGHTALHTGNKPFGSYTGNGDATARTIATGGVGKVCLIYSAYSIVIATPYGAQYFGLSTQAYGPLSVYFSDGTLTLVDSTNYTNGNGVTYYYQVL